MNSDLSLADGMPVVWLARLLGIPLPERVAGSDVFDALRNGGGQRIKVYFFGGPPGIAERAAQQINSEHKGMECVGFESPGYGSVEEMSSASTLGKINQSGADFLVVSLGAAKGQAWIERNLDALNVPVVSHLGAVINFVVGSVRRAPLWMQKMGLEWLWRVKEEPELWRRYFNDGRALLMLILTRLPLAMRYRWQFNRRDEARRHGGFKCVESADGTLLQLYGQCIQQNIPEFRLVCDRWCVSEQASTIDTSNINYIDSSFLAMLQLLYSHRLSQGRSLQFVAKETTNKHNLHIRKELGLDSL